MRRVFPWSMLGIDADADEPAVRRAYATKLKAMDPDVDHQGFERLREARDRALALARSRGAAAVKNQDDEPDDWLAEANGADQWQPGSRDYDEDDSPVASDSADPASASMLYDGIAVTVLRGDVSTGRPMPTLAGVAEPGLSIAAPAIDPERLAGSVHGMDVRAADPDPSMSDPQFSLATQSLDRPDRDDAIVTLSALTHMIDGNLATSQDAIYRLMLDTDRNVALSAEEVALVSSHLDVIFGDARMQEIGFAADMELWLAEVFARSTPRADPLVQRLADQFGWRAEAGTVNQPRTIAWLTDCALAFDFRDKVTQPTNKGYKAWIELTTPADAGSKRGSVKHVRELISTIREKHPLLERELDWYRVSLWDGSLDGAASGGFSGSDFPWVALILPLVFFLSIVSRCDENVRSPDQPYAPTFSDSAYDAAPSSDARQVVEVMRAEFDNADRRQVTIEDVLRKVAGSDYSADDLKADGPALYAVLDAKLVDLKSQRGALEQAEPDLEALLHRRILGSVSTVPYSLLVRWRRAQSQVLTALAAESPQRCADFIRGIPLSGASALADGADAYRAASLAMLLAGSTEAADTDGEIAFRARMSTVEDAARRTGMTLDRWQQVYAGEAGPGQDYCLVTASILDAAIVAPREESERVLRDL